MIPVQESNRESTLVHVLDITLMDIQQLFLAFVCLFNINIQNLGNSRKFWEIRAGGHKQIPQKIFSGHKVYVYVIFGY